MVSVPKALGLILALGEKKSSSKQQKKRGFCDMLHKLSKSVSTLTVVKAPIPST